MKKIIKEKNKKNRKLLAIGCIALIIISMFSMTTFAAESWYTPNETLTVLDESPNYIAFWLEIEYVLGGETYSYHTRNAGSTATNVNASSECITFGSYSGRDIVQYCYSSGWRVREAITGDVIPISYTDVKMKLHVLDESQITDFISWFDENFTVVSLSHGNILTEFIGIFVGGIGEMASGIGSGVNEYAQDLFLNVDSNGAITGLSTFGGVVAIFGGIALACGLTALIFNWIRKIGN